MNLTSERPGHARVHSLVESLDEANQALLAQAHPPGWTNPRGGGVYDLVVIGGAQFAATVHPYPTEAEAFRMVGDRYRRSALTPTDARWLSRYFRWTRVGSGS